MQGVRAATQRYDGVDVLRGISILAVILLHMWLRLYLSGYDLKPALPAALFRLLFRNGGNGVTVFFAVSGFLITYTSLRRFGSLAGMKPAVFYRIRFARIAPLLLAVLAILSVLHLAHVNGFRIGHGITLPRALLSALTFHLNWLEAKRGYLPANWDVMWSLSIEEMFYLFFPMACVVLLRRRRGMPIFVLLLLTLMVLAPLGRTVWAANDLEAEKSYLGGMGCIAMGCLTALVLRRWQQRGQTPGQGRLLALAWTGAVLMFVAAPPVPLGAWHNFLGRTDLDDTLLTLGACMVILGLVARNRAGSRWTAPLRWYGRLSYEVYLLHEFFVVAMTALALRTGATSNRAMLLETLLVVLLSGAAGYAAARWFTEPLNRRLRGAPHPAELRPS